MEYGVKHFKYNDSDLTEDDKLVLEHLAKVGEVVNMIWKKQVNPKTKEASFFVKGLTKEKVLELEKDTVPHILSPYTVVRKEGNGYKTIPYHIEYSEEIEQISNHLSDAIAVTKDREIKKHLSTTKKLLSKGKFEELLIHFLKNKESKIEIMLGPIESYADKLMGVKKAFQMNIAIKYENGNDDVAEMTDTLLNVAILRPYLSTSAGNLMNIRVDDAVTYYGRSAGSGPASVNLPNEARLVSKYGVKVVVYNNSLRGKYTELFSPFLDNMTILDSDPFETGRMTTAAQRLIILHELTEGLVKFPGMQRRLGSNYDATRELNAYLLGIKGAQYHYLNGFIEEQEYKDILTMLFVVGMDKFTRMEVSDTVYEYARGFAVLFTYLLDTKSLVLDKDKHMTIDINKASVAVDALSSIVLSLLHEGTQQEADDFFGNGKYLSVVKKLPVTVVK